MRSGEHDPSFFLYLMNDDRDRTDGPALAVTDSCFLGQRLAAGVERDDVLSRGDEAAPHALETPRLLAGTLGAHAPGHGVEAGLALARKLGQDRPVRVGHGDLDRARGLGLEIIIDDDGIRLVGREEVAVAEEPVGADAARDALGLRLR